MRATPLADRHRAAGARFTEFAGWQLPLQFAGIVAEHGAVRERCGVFDVSHMGRLRLVGPRAAELLARWLSRRVRDQAPGRVRYALALAEDGTILDDLLAARLGDYEFLLVVNAVNREALLARWQPQTAPASAVLGDETLATAMLAVQGPRAAAVLAAIGIALSALPRFGCRLLRWQGGELLVSRTGYTGEDGAELICAAEAAGALWDALLAAGAQPCGLGARDTLRLEAGLPLYGHELSRAVYPGEVGLDWAVDGDDEACGVAAARAAGRAGLRRRLVGLIARSRRVPRPGYAVLRGERRIGAISSGSFSPTLGQAIAMALIAADCATPGSEVSIDIRGEPEPAELVALPFYRRS
ncbi:MAG: glycine cleavage system aminomethyltransferase GcvT [Planctomycetota bacterium]|nr:glycine cleavage system aminomethyltransferase GcvT [Planctomycetota bacterium]